MIDSFIYVSVDYFVVPMIESAGAIGMCLCCSKMYSFHNFCI